MSTRRNFLKYAGFGLASFALHGCQNSSTGNFLTLNNGSEDRVTFTNAGDIALLNSGDVSADLSADSNRTATDTSLSTFSANWNGTVVSTITFNTGDDTGNKDEGYLSFSTAAGGSLTEALRIEQTGNIGIPADNEIFLDGLDTSGGASIFFDTGVGVRIKENSVNALLITDTLITATNDAAFTTNDIDPPPNIGEFGKNSVAKAWFSVSRTGAAAQTVQDDYNVSGYALLTSFDERVSWDTDFSGSVYCTPVGDGNATNNPLQPVHSSRAAGTCEFFENTGAAWIADVVAHGR